MKLLSRLFRAPPTPPPAVAVAPPPPAPPEPAALAIDPAAQDQLLREIESAALAPAELMRLAVEGQTTRLRQAAAAAITDPAAWQALLPPLRGRDKAAYKLLKDRVDARAAAQRQVAQIRADAEELCASIERHAGRTHDLAFVQTLALYSARWKALPADVDDEIRQRGQQALDRAHEATAAHVREQARLAGERAAEEARAAALAAEHESRQRAEEERAAAEAMELAVAAQMRAAEAEAEAQALSEKQSAESQAHGNIQSLIRLSGAALARGDTRKAGWFRQSIETALPAVAALPPALARQLEQLDERLNQLRQWKDYAAAPKRAELIEAMEALIGADEAPANLVEHIRALRQEWRTINKGLAVDAPAEAERFEQAYAAAFQPCQVYLAEQAGLRRANLAARQQVLERVLAFEAGLAQQPDHPLMMRVLREAPQEWRGHAPVDRDAGRALDAEFFGALDRLRTVVNAWHAQNAAEKQALIARAQQLASEADLDRATDEVKRLQAQWKTTGPVPHAQSQALWEEFRGLCNAVYERREQEFAQHSAVLGQAKSAAEALCAQIEEAGQEGPSDRSTGEAQLRAWQETFHALGEFPRADARSLGERYQRAMSRYASRMDGLAARAAEAAETQALEAARKVRAYERAVLRGDAERETLRTEADAFIAGVPRWPSKGVLQALRQSLARAGSEDAAADDTAREQALRRLCIHAEILGSTATPPEDAGLRREQEMQLLRQGLGQTRQADDRAWQAMRIEWLGLPAAEPLVHDELEKRFMRAWNQRRRAV